MQVVRSNTLLLVSLMLPRQTNLFFMHISRWLRAPEQAEEMMMSSTEMGQIEEGDTGGKERK